MYIDKDNWGSYSINELTPKDVKFLSKAIKAYVRANFGNISKREAAQIWMFDRELKEITDEQTMDTGR